MTTAPAVADLLDLSGRVAIVTGATGNIGEAIARRLNEAGASVVVHSHGDAAAADALVASLGSRAVAVTGDVERDAASICAVAIDAFGRLDVVVNNAGVQPVAALMDLTADDVSEVLRVNVGGVIAMTREAAATMTDAGGGGRDMTRSIVNISSIEGLHPANNHSHYVASKAAVVMHTRAAALELGPNWIRVNCVSPGLIHAAGLEDAWPDGVARWHASVPLGRLGRSVDVADAVLFLASDGARWISGANVVVDGGVLCHNTW
jgi:3-oxoacyl-[acyl-carrier protein] reductase